ncbi:MAG TPA: TIR domain-containing protein [Reyranellaceae bacterium]|nr:TIR domain-containing protein [Reyranellaceae bacterium]
MNAFDIFVSYAHEDRERAKVLVAALSAEGWQVFWDRTIPPGESWRSWIGAPLGKAPIVIVCWSKHSIESDWVCQEADAAAKRRVLLPVFIDEVTPPLGLAHIHGADLVAWTAEGGGKLPAILKHAIVRKLPGAGALPPDAASATLASIETTPPRPRVEPATPEPAATRSRVPRYAVIGAATAALLALLVGGYLLLGNRPAPPAEVQSGPKPVEIGQMRQNEVRDGSGKVTVEAATIHVIACGGGSTPGIYVYEYANRPGFRAVQPPNWGTALGGRDFNTLAQAIAAGCAAAPASGAVLGPPYDGFALGAGDILRFYGSPSESACRADCEREGSGCQAYTWVKPGGYTAGEPPVCYLMASFKNPVRHKCCVTATRGPFPSP